MHEYYLYFLLLSFLFFIGLKLLQILKNKRIPAETIRLENLTVIIPFRNEEENFPKLLASFDSQTNFPKSIVFIDDHSTDNSMSLLEEFCENKDTVKILSLPKEEAGKKAALKMGVSHAETTFVLTLDADVVLNSDYFESLQDLPTAALVVLPVLMQGNSFLEKLFSLEYQFFNAFNFLLAPFYPISSSGANLIFDKTQVDYSKQVNSHVNHSSGDDYFLLKYLRKKKAAIYYSNDNRVSVRTDAPRDVKEYLSQRVRWLKKSKHQIRIGELTIGLFTLVYLLGGFYVEILCLYTGMWKLFFSIFCIRMFMDVFLLINYVAKNENKKIIGYLPFFHFLYPPLLLLVFIASLFYKPEWKGRKVIS